MDSTHGRSTWLENGCGSTSSFIIWAWLRPLNSAKCIVRAFFQVCVCYFLVFPPLCDSIIMQNSKRRRSKSPFRFRSSHSPSPSSRSGSGRSTPSINGVAVPLEEGKASPVKLSPSQTPVDRRSLASLASSGSAGLTPSSTMEGLNTPSLPKVITIKKCQLRKRPPESEVSGWGFVLRGTTSEFKSGARVYTCHIELVKEGGAAQVCLQHKQAIVYIIVYYNLSNSPSMYSTVDSIFPCISLIYSDHYISIYVHT